ncbi:MAG: hypothetical protein IKC58_01195 [Clostridia bacterium]|nr:hypothetical protein [Clostridia bacterium]MBR2985201.1 hypothetical protein [Clostridia bacterium]
MKEYDRVELVVDREKYTKQQVFKGMEGWICDPRKIEGKWLVCFDLADHLPEYPIISVLEEDLKVTSE